MTGTAERELAETNRRRRPIQIANEKKMIRATIELVVEYPVGQITSRMIVERSGTATNYISRYFGGRDALLAATALELGIRIAEQIDVFGTRPHLDQPLAFLEEVVALPEVTLWFKLSRYLATRNLVAARGPGSRPPVVDACEAAVARMLRIEGEDARFWANVFLTYIMGGLAFGPLLGTSQEEGGRALARLGSIAETQRDHQIGREP